MSINFAATVAMCHTDNSHTIEEWFLAGWVDSRQHVMYAGPLGIEVEDDAVF